MEKNGIRNAVPVYYFAIACQQKISNQPRQPTSTPYLSAFLLASRALLIRRRCRPKKGASNWEKSSLHKQATRYVMGDQPTLAEARLRSTWPLAIRTALEQRGSADAQSKLTHATRLLQREALSAFKRPSCGYLVLTSACSRVQLNRMPKG